MQGDNSPLLKNKKKRKEDIMEKLERNTPAERIENADNPVKEELKTNEQNLGRSSKMSKVKRKKKTKKNSNCSNQKSVSRNKSSNSSPLRDWFIIGTRNGMKCACDDEIINDVIPGVAIFTTYGMESYNHLDFELVLNCETIIASYILNSLGDCVQAGRRFKDGENIKDLFKCGAYLKIFNNGFKNVLRVIVPDEKYLFPGEEGCNPAYCFQLLPTEQLYLK